MNVRLVLLRLHLPGFVRRSIIRDLIAAAARAFWQDPPPTSNLRSRELVTLAIDRSRMWADDAIRTRADLDRIKQRMFLETFEMGRRARRRLRVETEAEGLAAARIIYRAIGIDFRPRGYGHIEVPRCAFARAYGANVCRLMSSMDSGLIAGLTDADGLHFTERITEGAAACRALVLRPGAAT